jgi:ribosomal protein S18 acetylase RimI-like enzyme
MLRLAVRTDVDAIVDMMAEFYAADGLRFDPAEARRAVAELIAAPERGVIALLAADAVTGGYIVIAWGYSLQYGGRDAFVDEIYVRPSHQGRGLGREALEYAEQLCRDAGARALHLEVRPDNQRALAVYRAAGFVDHDHRLMTRLLSR